MRLMLYLLFLPIIVQGQLLTTGVLQQEYNANFQVLLGGIGSNGRLYSYNGSKWEEVMPIGDNGASWNLIAAYKKKRLAGVDNGRLYYYDGSSWSEQQPAGDVNQRWNTGSIYEDKMMAAAYNGRLYYYDGSSWSEQQPAGDVSKTWINVSLYKNKAVACYGFGRLYYFNGSSWSDLQPTGDQNETWVSCAIYDDKIIASKGSSLYFYDGSTWIESDPDTTGVSYLAVDIYKNKLAACTFSEYDGAVYCNDGASWVTLLPSGGYGGDFWGISLRGNRIIVTGLGTNYYNGSKWEALFIDPYVNTYNVSISVH